MFKTEDVILLAKTVQEWETAFQFNSSDYERDHWECMYCGERIFDDFSFMDIKHKPNCPYLVAQDILTGFET